MKFLVLALCVCAASAASFGSNKQSFGTYKPFPGFASGSAKAVAQVGAPVIAPVVVPVAKAGAAVYEPAQQVVTKNVPYTSDVQAETLRSETEVKPDSYNYVYETSNGIAAEAVGSFKRVGDADVFTSQGSYRYTAPDGTPVLFTYVADENGFQPQSNLLPVAPEIPEAIVRSLNYIASRSAASDNSKNY